MEFGASRPIGKLRRQLLQRVRHREDALLVDREASDDEVLTVVGSGLVDVEEMHGW